MTTRFHQKTTTIIQWVIFISAILLNITLVCGITFIYPFSFNYETDINDQYYLALFWPFAIMVIALYITTFRCRFSVMQIGFLLFAFTVSSLLIFSKYYHWGNEHFFVVITIMLVTGLILFIRSVRFVHFLFMLLSALFLYQLYAGYTQYFEAIHYADSVSLALKGTFQNSGVMAMCLVAQWPLFHFVAVTLCFKKCSPTVQLLRLFFFSTVFIVTLFLVYQTQSRTAWIAMAVTVIAWLLFQKGTIIRKKIGAIPKITLLPITITALAIMSFAAYYLFALKKASAFGRMMKLEITGQHIGDHFFTGTGLGRFSWYYPQWQAEYFKLNTNPPQSFFLSAGESYIIFNEPFQLLKELGIVGFVLFIIGLTFFFSIRSIKYFKVLSALKLTAIAILSCSFTSYPLHVNYLLWMFFICFFAAFALGRPMLFSLFERHLPLNVNKRIQIFLAAVTLLIAAVATVKGITSFKAYQQWAQLQNSYLSSDETLKQYPKLKTVLGKDGKFLTSYGSALLDAGRASEAGEILEEARTYHISVETIELLGRAYNESGQMEKAIMTQEWLCDFLPNKFRTKLELLKLYQKINDSVNAKHIAQVILTMPVKIPSAEVERIKNEARQ